MRSRKDYMDGKVSHEDYYGQYVTPEVTALVMRRFGADRVKASTDEHFNDLPLSMWDALACQFKPVFTTGETDSLSTRVCILKAAARRIREGAKCA